MNHAAQIHLIENACLSVVAIGCLHYEAWFLAGVVIVALIANTCFVQFRRSA